MTDQGRISLKADNRARQERLALYNGETQVQDSDKPTGFQDSAGPADESTFSMADAAAVAHELDDQEGNNKLGTPTPRRAALNEGGPVPTTLDDKAEHVDDENAEGQPGLAATKKKKRKKPTRSRAERGLV